MATTEVLFPADDAAVAAAVAAARRFAADLPHRLADRLVIIVEELVENLIEHAVQPPGAMIRLGLWIEGGRLWLRLVDAAVPFDPRRAEVAPIPARGGGAGLAMVRAWTRIDTYERVDGGNVLLLSMPLSG